MRAHVGPSVSLSAVIIRACDQCHGKRALGKPCETCGNRKAAKVEDLGVIADHQHSRWKRLKWNLWGYHLAQHRIRKVNRDMLRESLRKA